MESGEFRPQQWRGEHSATFMLCTQWGAKEVSFALGATNLPPQPQTKESAARRHKCSHGRVHDGCRALACACRCLTRLRSARPPPGSRLWGGTWLSWAGHINEWCRGGGRGAKRVWEASGEARCRSAKRVGGGTGLSVKTGTLHAPLAFLRMPTSTQPESTSCSF